MKHHPNKSNLSNENSISDVLYSNSAKGNFTLSHSRIDQSNLIIKISQPNFTIDNHFTQLPENIFNN